MGKLYLVSTPIGNLKDISFRALAILKEVDLVLAEDTRKTGLLLAHYQIKKPFLSYFEENEERRIPEVIQRLKNGEKIALVSNAGTPTISDPGFKLVRECLKEEISVEAIPGASAILTALVSSGLPTDKFFFLGYLPKKQGKRQKLFQDLNLASQYLKTTYIFYESPYRLIASLNNLKEAFGDIEIVVCRELTKIHEETRREKISQAIVHFEKTKPKGEMTLLFSLAAK